jgi:DNA-directed RNA polymerase beta subunit
VIDISEGYDDRKIIDLLLDYGIKPISGESVPGSKVYVNGNLIGVTDSPKTLVDELRERRRNSSLCIPPEKSNEVNIRYNEYMNSVIINCDEGRLRRPLLIVKDGKLGFTKKHLENLQNKRISFNDLIQEGIIEFIDAEEEENTLIAITPDEITNEYTHCEIDPMVILGVCAGLVPYSEQVTRFKRIKLPNPT